MSIDYFTNIAITDNLVKFIYKCRMQLLACNSLLHRYYPRVYPKSCPLCRNPHDTVSHVLNGCMNFQDMYSRRHDRIVNHIHQQLTTTNSDLIVFNNRIVTAAMFNSESEGLYGSLIHRKPDLIVINESEMKVFVVEISTPIDAFINQC